MLLVEFTIEPFTEGNPGQHVRAAVDAADNTSAAGPSLACSHEGMRLDAVAGAAPVAAAGAPQQFPSAPTARDQLCSVGATSRATCIRAATSGV